MKISPVISGFQGFRVSGFRFQALQAEAFFDLRSFSEGGSEGWFQVPLS